MLVDPGISAAAATTFLADVKTLTNKPVKYVVDTHYHYDHAFGNQVFGPDVTIIGHDTTRRRLNGPGSLKERTYLTNSTAAIANRFTLLKRQISEATDAKERAIYERQLAIHQQYADEQPKLKPTPPNATLSRDMTLHRGSREIQIRFFGRAHTDGDIVVFLPRERMVATGDMITSALSYTGDAFVEEWPATLEGGDVAGFRHGAARPRQRVQGQGSHPQSAGVLARFLSTGDRVAEAGRVARGSGQADRSDASTRARFPRQRTPASIRAASIAFTTSPQIRTRLCASQCAAPVALFARSPRTIVVSDPNRILRAARYRAARSSRSRWP